MVIQGWYCNGHDKCCSIILDQSCPLPPPKTDPSPSLLPFQAFVTFASAQLFNAILLLQKCVIFIRWISSIRSPKAILSLSHITFFYYSSNLRFPVGNPHCSINLRTTTELFSVWFQNCVHIFQDKDQIVSTDTNML